MSVLLRHQPRGLTRDRYDDVNRRLEEAGVAWPPDGLDLHVLFGSEGSLLVSEIWDSEEQFRAFGERLFPVLNDVGVELGGEPELFEVQEIQRR
jgi:hypothetical protein